MQYRHLAICPIAPEERGGEDGIYTVIGDAKSMPRVNIGKGIAAELRLRDGRFEQRRVRRGEILVMLG